MIISTRFVCASLGLNELIDAAWYFSMNEWWRLGHDIQWSVNRMTVGPHLDIVIHTLFISVQTNISAWNEVLHVANAVYMKDNVKHAGRICPWMSKVAALISFKWHSFLSKQVWLFIADATLQCMLLLRNIKFRSKCDSCMYLETHLPNSAWVWWYTDAKVM